MTSSLFILFTLYIIVVVKSAEVPCTYTDPSGNYYDLSPLSLCDNSGYTVPTSDETFVINVCNTVGGCDGSPALCQNGQYNTGSSTSQTFSPYSGGKGVTVQYTGGDSGGCPNNKGRASNLNFICDSTAATPQFSFINESPTCTYNFNVRSKYACPTTKAPQIVTCPIYVYLVPHTHDDVGWILSADGYYHQEVKHILDTVTSSLLANPARRFIYVEQAYFWRWWTDTNTTNQQRADFKTIYQRGQLEFVIGGWVMQDEACTTYGADIDQMTLGHQFLLNTFGAIPTKGWQIDPFGQSSVTPTLNKLSGFDAHVINRVTYKDSYEASKRLQFNWYGSPSLGSDVGIFTEIMAGAQNAYCDWFFTFGFDKDPVNSGNVASWASKFYDMVNSRTSELQTNVILAPWGCDFAFQNATADFNSMDKLVAYLQQNTQNSFVHVQYATLSDYFTALKAVPYVEYPSNYGGDFFPLFEDLYWTGYFTSRTELKGLTRKGEAASSVVEPLFAFSKLLKQNVDTTTAYNNIGTLRLANADAQHHDGVTGTSEPDVVDWFEEGLRSGITAGLQTSANVLSSFISKGQSTQAISPNIQALPAISGGQVVPIVLYNSLGWVRDEFVVLSVNQLDLSVVDYNNSKVASQINDDQALNATGKYNLFFQATVPAYGFITYFIVSGSSVSEPNVEELELGSDATLTNGHIVVTISGTTALISNIGNIPSGFNTSVIQNLMQYKSFQSGAYAFAPAGPATPVSSQPPSTSVSSGILVTEAYQVFPTSGGSYAKQNIRLYTSNNPDVSSFIEISHQLGQLPSNCELITSFSTGIQNNQYFSTDDNGFEFLNREGLWNVPIGGNYYPTIYASFIRDTTAQLTIVSDRSHGVSSLNNGELEMMLHRNPDMGDGFGPGLTDTDTVAPVIRVLLDTPAATTLQVRKQPFLLNFPLAVFSGAASPSVSSWTSKYASTAQFITGALPANVHLQSFYSLDATSTNFIFRLTHLFAINEDPVYSKPATVDVAALFSNFKITKFQETTLTANQVLTASAPTTVTLTAKQIRTFIVSF